MRLAALAIVMFSAIFFASCMSSGGGNWGPNIALQATGRDPKYNDDNLYTEGETGPVITDDNSEEAQLEADKYSAALLEWGRPQTIQRVVVKAKEGEMEFFEIQYEDQEGKWQTLNSVSNNLREEYAYTHKEPITTRKLRLKVPTQWESRRMSGQKRSVGEGGAPSVKYRKIREIEVYYAVEPSMTGEQ